MRAITSIIVRAGIFLALAGLATSGQAAPATFVCDVVKVGTVPTTGRIVLTATNAAFTNRSFSIPDSARNQMLAMAIAAMTSNLQVQVKVDAALSGSPPIIQMFLLAPP